MTSDRLRNAVTLALANSEPKPGVGPYGPMADAAIRVVLDATLAIVIEEYQLAYDKRTMTVIRRIRALRPLA